MDHHTSTRSQGRAQAVQSPQPTTADDPSLRVRMSLKEDMLYAELKDVWVNGGSNFSNAFIEDCCLDEMLSRRADDAVKDFLSASPSYSGGQWVSIPKDPKKGASLIRAAHADNIQEILLHFGLDLCRRAVNSRHVHMDRVYDTGKATRQRPGSPHITLLGVGDSLSSSAFFPEQPTYAQCISPIEVVMESSMSLGSELMRLAIYARECFAQSRGRHFVYCVLLTERRFLLVKFDRVGGMYSNWIDFHREPCRFVRAILRLSVRDEKRLGFDTSIFWRGGFRFIRTSDATGGTTEYKIYHPVFFTSEVRGRGAVCWLGSAMGKWFIIKDSWQVAEAADSEWTHIERARGLDGVVQVVSRQEESTCVSETRWGVKMITDHPLRRDRWVLEDRIFCRMVMKCYGEPIDMFRSRKELLCAFHDAVAGHRNLWRIGILHRDVSAGNILLGDPKSKANRGVLIDLDLSLAVSSLYDLSYGTKFGTPPFKSLSILRGNFVHDHLDDLESFFWVLCWICFSHEKAGHAFPVLPSFLSRWDSDEEAPAKSAFLLNPLGERVPIWFGEIFQSLLSKLHAFCQTRHLAKLGATFDVANNYNPQDVLDGKAPLGFRAEDDYEQYLSIISDAIVELGDAPDGRDILTPAESRVNVPPVDKATCESDSSGDKSKISRKRSRVTENEDQNSKKRKC